MTSISNSHAPLVKARSARVPIGFSIAIFGAALTWLPATSNMPRLALAFVITLVGLLVAMWHEDRGAVSATSVYLIVFSSFHGGLIVATALIGSAAYVGLDDNSWISVDNLKSSVEIVALTMVAFGLGAQCAPRISVDQSPANADLIRERLAIAGKILIPIGLILTGRTVLVGGLGILASGYNDFFAASAGRQFAYGIGFVMTGCGLLICSGGANRRFGWIIFGILALIALPIGLRGPLLFPAAAFVVVEARRRRISWVTVLPAIIGLLTLTSVLRQTRTEGIRALFDLKGVGFAPIQGLAEMGYTIRPVYIVRDWMAAGLPPWHGISLIAPILRTFERFTGSLPANPDLDFRLFNVEIFNRAGPIGGSPVAEGLRNGGIPFAIGLLFVLGLVIGTLDKLPSSPAGSAGVVLYLAPLLAQTRNGFASVPAQWIIATIVMFLVLRWPAKKELGSSRGG